MGGVNLLSEARILCTFRESVGVVEVGTLNGGSGGRECIAYSVKYQVTRLRAMLLSFVQVWGSEARGAHHGPPHQIIWRNQKTWGAGGRTITKLMNKSSEVGQIRVVQGCMQTFCKGGGGGGTWGILKRGGAAANSIRGSTGRQC